MMTKPIKLIDDAAQQRDWLPTLCTSCSLMCDDVLVTLDQNVVHEVQNACPRGEQWFRRSPAPGTDSCLINNVPVSFDTGIDQAVMILKNARFPLIYGLGESTGENQRVVVAIADWLGATLDSATSQGHATSVQAFQRVGKTTCTLGEIRNRADLLVYWGVNPVVTHPRLLSRYTLMASGRWVPNGRSDRHCVVVDVKPTETAELADEFIRVRPGSDFEAICGLRALLRGIPVNVKRLEQSTGVTVAVWRSLLDRMKNARFGSILFGMGVMRSRGEEKNCATLFELGRELNEVTAFVCRSARGDGNVTGADKVLSWNSGFPFAINFAAGYPRYQPGEYSGIDMLHRGEPDAVMFVGPPPLPHLSVAAIAHLQSVPVITLSEACGLLPPSVGNPNIVFRTRTKVLEEGGSYYRLDEVPLHVRPLISSSWPSEQELLEAIELGLRPHS